jgi:peptidyl-prolyl cis-trans isomerase SurA
MKTLTSTLLLTIFFLAAGQSKGQVLDKIIAKVDNQIVLQSELDITYIQMVSQDQSQNPQSENLKCQVFENLIINKVLLAKAEIDSVTVEKDVVEEQINRRMSYFIQQVGGDASKLEAQFNKSIDELKNDLRRSVKEQMVIQKMQETITSKVKVTPSQVKKFFGEIPTDSLPNFSIEVEVGQIVIVPEIGKDQKAAAKAKLQGIRDRILNGEDFCKLAQTYSEDPGSAPACGQLGWFKRGELVPPYEAAALKLKPGGYSDIVESEFGFHFIQLIERRANEYNSRHILIKPNTSTKDVGRAEKILDSLRTAILADSVSFEKAANDFSKDRMTKENGGFFIDQASGSSKIPLENLEGVVFFTIDTMKVGDISYPIPFRMEDGTEALRIIYLKSKTPAHQANLKDDYQKIYKAALSEEKDKVLNQWYDKTVGEVFMDVAPEYKDCKILKTQGGNGRN